MGFERKVIRQIRRELEVGEMDSKKSDVYE